MIRTVLLVGDDADDREAIQTGVARYHDTFSLAPARTSEDAAGALERGLVCLVVLDLASPSLDGPRFLSRTRLDYPDIPIIVLGGQGEDHHPNGVLARLGKPVKIGELTRTIFQALKKQADGGIMPGVSPAVFVQLVEMENWTCTMRLIRRDTGQGGILFFRSGQLLDARVGPQRGFEAAQHIFTWDGVTLFIENDCVLTANRINSEIQPIIMQAVILKDDPGRKHADPPHPAPAEEAPDGSASDGPGDVEEIDALLDEDVEWVPMEEDLLERLDERLRDEVGEKCGVANRYFDDERTGAVDGLDELGWQFGLGRFRVGSLHQPDRGDVILLSHQPPVVLALHSRSRQERILQALSNGV